MPFIEGISSAKTIPAKGATGVWEGGGNFILKDPGNYIDKTVSRLALKGNWTRHPMEFPSNLNYLMIVQHLLP